MSIRWFVVAALAAAPLASQAATASASVCLRGWSLQDLRPQDGIAAALSQFGGYERQPEPNTVGLNAEIRLLPGRDLGVPGERLGATVVSQPGRDPGEPRIFGSTGASEPFAPDSPAAARAPRTSVPGP